MLSFTGARNIFAILLVISSICVIILFFLYFKQRQNYLLQSCCVVVIVKCLILFVFLPPCNLACREPTQYDIARAILLNYLMISVHAHMSFLMLESCSQAFGWRKFRISLRGKNKRTVRFIVLSYLLPLIPTFYLIHQEFTSAVKMTRLYAFYWAIYYPSICTRHAMCFFSYIGMFLSTYLLFRTTRLRISTLDQNLTTQLSIFYILRINLTTLMYWLFGLSAIYPLENLRTNQVLFNILESNTRVPHIYSYTYSLVGITLFIIFGYGSPARQSYKEILGWLRNAYPVDEVIIMSIKDRNGSGSSFTVLSDENEFEEGELMDFKSALNATGPPSVHHYRTWTIGSGSTRRLSEPSISTVSSPSSI